LTRSTPKHRPRDRVDESGARDLRVLT